MASTRGQTARHGRGGKSQEPAKSRSLSKNLNAIGKTQSPIRNTKKKRSWRNQLTATAIKGTKYANVASNFTRAAADIGIPVNQLVEFLVSETSTTLSSSCSLDSITKKLLGQIYKDIHDISAPGLLLSTSDPTMLGAARIQGRLALETAAAIKVLEYVVCGNESNELHTKTLHAVNEVRIQPDNLGRVLTVADNEKRLCRRYASFAKEHGYMMTCILAASACFRETARTVDAAVWQALAASISVNRNSLEYFAKIRGLEWRLILANSLDEASLIADPFGEGQHEIKPGHPHEFIVPETSMPPQRPNFEGHDQLNVLTTIYCPEDFAAVKKPDAWEDYRPWPSDPRIVLNGNPCEICDQCQCSCAPLACPWITHPLVELVHFGDRGTGIRVLQSVRKSETLAEYVGEVKPASFPDPVYSMAISVKFDNLNSDIAQISSKRLGNWTRFINHSCDASTEFIGAIVGNKSRIFVQATRDIETFEEVTVNYGPEYWAGPGATQLCQCGASSCEFATEAIREQTRKRLWPLGNGQSRP